MSMRIVSRSEEYDHVRRKELRDWLFLLCCFAVVALWGFALAWIILWITE